MQTPPHLRKFKYGGVFLSLLLAVALVYSRNLPFYKGEQKDRTSLPQKAVVTRVIDGDTIVIDNGYRVRYIGINTPETKHPKKEVEYFGKEASLFNRSLVMGREVRLEYDVQRFDKYGRILAYVYADDIFINAELVKEGYAQIFTMPPNVKYAALFLDMQKDARAMGRGLWQEFVDEIK